ncbi:DUF7424 family protein [Gilliamella sp. wkB171]|uniref:DUF7424 family protein n=1 Tax=Gilliamella sp. wkB171 TaxID=3120258 RepID=UPI0008135AB5|nr:hypothetical protein [Gilliamella apicola]OCL18746.1 hypothetical protein A9G03_10015 [Gilliamella apicola]
MKKILLISFISAMLLGCDANVETTVTISQLDAKPSFAKGNLTLEVPACSDYKDSRSESSSLITAKKEIAQLFKSVEYKECYTQKMKSYASFEIPILVGQDTSDTELLKQADILTVKHDKGIYAITNPEFTKKLIQYKKKAMSNIDFKISISLINDTDKSIDKISVTKAFIDNRPYDAAEFSLTPNAKVTITLSDVSTQILLNPTTDSNNKQGITEIAKFQ